MPESRLACRLVACMQRERRRRVTYFFHRLPLVYPAAADLTGFVVGGAGVLVVPGFRVVCQYSGVAQT